jgi:hypothetical protein
MTDEENVEVVPLTSRVSFSSQISNQSRLQRSLSFQDTSSEGLLLLLKQAVAAVCFFLSGWYYPRYLIHAQDGIAETTPPYQQTKAGDIVLDFSLNESLVDPPTIPCTYDTEYVSISISYEYVRYRVCVRYRVYVLTLFCFFSS